MARILVVVRKPEWDALSEEQRQQVTGNQMVAHVQGQWVGSFQPSDLPAEVRDDRSHTHLVFWNTYPRFGQYADNDRFRDARPGLQVVELGERAEFQALLDAVTALEPKE